MAEREPTERPVGEFQVPSYKKYHAPRYEFNKLPTVKLDFFLVLDFEAIPDCPDLKEIIEFPVLKVNARTLRTEAIFHSYVQPIIHPRITPLCTELTGITQNMVDGQPTLPQVLKSLDDWMKREGLLEKGVEFCFVTCGDWDLKTALPVNCHYLKLRYPDYLKRWINIKTYFQAIVRKKGSGMKRMLDELGLALDGRHHSGIDDSKNIAKIVAELARRDDRLKEGLVEPTKMTHFMCVANQKVMD